MIGISNHWHCEVCGELITDEDPGYLETVNVMPDGTWIFPTADRCNNIEVHVTHRHAPCDTHPDADTHYISLGRNGFDEGMNGNRFYTEHVPYIRGKLWATDAAMISLFTAWVRYYRERKPSAAYVARKAELDKQFGIRASDLHALCELF